MGGGWVSTWVGYLHRLPCCETSVLESQQWGRWCWKDWAASRMLTLVGDIESETTGMLLKGMALAGRNGGMPAERLHWVVEWVVK